MKALAFVVAVCSSLLVVATFAPTRALAGECVSGNCGTPTQSGGGCGCGCGCGCSILIAMTDRGLTYQFADDQDGDGVEDDFDNCAFISNYDQSDADGDQVGDSCDNCAAAANSLQGDINLNGIGDACDVDADGDGIPNANDNCFVVPNPSQANNDGDADGDICDTDDDNDGIPDNQDPCRLIAGAASSSSVCDDDPDQDGLLNADDNCPEVSNAGSADIDRDGVGDACDADADGDGRENFRDNCAYVANPGQVDFDNDGLGDSGNFGTNGTLESCDTRECFVVDRAAYNAMSDSQKTASCLDPSHAFETRLALAGATGGDLQAGDVIEVRLFSNRVNEVHHWTATFDQQPDGSNTTLDNAMGSAATYPTTFQVGADPTFSTIRFKADKAGAYRVKVTTDLPNGDPQGLPVFASTQEIVAEVGEGSESSGGCASTRGESLLAAMALLAVCGAFRAARK